MRKMNRVNIKYKHLERVTSTQKYIKNIVSNKDITADFYIYADKQKNGYGRSGLWQSQKGGLYYSYFLHKKKNYIGIIVILAVKKTIDKYMNNSYIRLPNDIYIDSNKLAGVLIESIKDSYVIGIGININNKNLQSGISLFEYTNKKYNIDNIANELTYNIQYYLNLSKEQLEVEWKNQLNLNDKEIKYLDCQTSMTHTGVVNGLDLEKIQLDNKYYSFEQIRIIKK